LNEIGEKVDKLINELKITRTITSY